MTTQRTAPDMPAVIFNKDLVGLNRNGRECEVCDNHMHHHDWALMAPDGIVLDCSMNTKTQETVGIVPREVILIQRHDPDSWHSIAHYAAVAVDIDAAMKWIQDEVDQKHDSGHRYMQGETAEWWLAYGTFTLSTVTLHKEV